MFKHYIHFIYDGVDSRRMGVLHASFDSSLYEEDLLPSREVMTEKVRNRSNPYFKRLERSVRKFTMTIAIDGKIDTARERLLKQWLDVEYYKPLEFVDDREGRVVYCMPEGDTKITHNGMNGYITVNMVSNSPYLYGNYKVLKVLSRNNDEKTSYFTINNRGDKPVSIELWVKKTLEDGEVKIHNIRNGDVLHFTQITKDETIYYDGVNKYIETDNKFVVSRYDDFNNYWFNLELGETRFFIEGDCEINIRYREKYL